MRILFYSETCNFCLKLLDYIGKNKLTEYFKMICIDKTNNIPKNITIVPTVIDTEIQAQLEGKKAFEYVINQKYFNHPTNNIEYIKNGIPKPIIDEDTKANSARSNMGFIFVDKDNEKRFNEKEDKHNIDSVFKQSLYNISQNNTTQNNVSQNNTIINQIKNERNIQDSKFNLLMKLKKN